MGVKTNKPWKKAEQLSFDAELVAKFEGKLNYAKYKRVKWFAFNVPERANLTVELNYAPTDEAEASTVAFEILGPNNAVISADPDAPLDEEPAEKEDDDEEGEDDEEDDEDEEEEEEDDDSDAEGNTQKTRTIEVKPGNYMLHLFVLGRMDEAEYDLTVRYTPLEPVYESNFPHEVAFLPALPTVPVADDTEVAIERDPPPPPCKGRKCKKEKKEKKPKEVKEVKEPVEPEEPKSKTKVSGTINASSADGSGSEIVISVGAIDCVQAGDRGSIAGLGDKGGFTVTSCTNKSCRAKAPKATLSMVQGSSKSVTVKVKPCS
jgi:hypothetical protein